MNNAGKKLIIISFILAIAASICIFAYLKSLKSPKKEEVKKITILVASEKIPARTQITDKMIKKIEVPADSIFNNYISDESKISGKYTKYDILSNEGFSTDKLVDKDGNELGYKVEDNHRAVSMNAAGDSGVADLIKPGDYVDVVVFLAEKKDGTKVIREEQAKTIIQNIMVLAIDTQINRDEKQLDKVPNNFFVTLSVPISEVEKMILAESMGNVKLVLRPLKKEEDNKTTGITGSQLISDGSLSSSSQGNVNSNDNASSTQNTSSNTQSTASSSNTENNTGEKYGYYKIKEGDSLRQISIYFYGDADKYIIIQNVNGIKDENQINVGDTIKIPVLTN
ncbi:MAG: Flp pilus assembly protein CpaB [Bacillota bacterium]|nr:Flp pilus assembly protein CpaB [Bacillota bacterium]